MTVAIRILGDPQRAQTHSGWKEATISSSIETLAGAFELNVVTNRPAGRSWPIQRGDKCEVIADGQIAITGFVDRIEPGYDKESGRTITVAGRDRTADLVDCSAEPAHEWENTELAPIADKLCKPFDIVPAYNQVPSKKIPKHIVEQGETVLDCMSRACSYYGVLPFPDGHGGVVIGKAGAGTIEKPLLNGINVDSNVLKARAVIGDEQRYSEYILRGDPEGFVGIEDQIKQEGRASDPGVSRYRPLVVLADNVGETDSLKRRAAHMAKVRQARGYEFHYTVAGWTHGNDIWRPNHFVRVRDTELPLYGTMLVSKVTLKVNKREGTIAELVLVYPDTYAELARPPASGDSAENHQ